MKHVLHTDRIAKGPVSYFTSTGDATAVLAAFKKGDATVLGFTPGRGHIVIRVDDVTGFFVSTGTGKNPIPTNIFFVKGTSNPSIVPHDPNF